MPGHHVGSGRRRAIPLDWSAHHRLVFAGTRDATVSLHRPGGVKGAFDQGTGKWDITPPAAYFTGPARIQELPTKDRRAVVGEQDVTTVVYAVQLDPSASGFQIEDVCTVTAMDDNGDADLVGRHLLIRSFGSGSLYWERRLVCTLSLETVVTP